MSWIVAIIGPKENKLFNPSRIKRVSVFPPIFDKELDYKCSERRDDMLGKWETKFWRLGDQKFGENLPQPTRKLRTRKKHFQGILEN